MPYEIISPSTARALDVRIARAQRDGRVPSVVASMARRGEPAWFGAAGLVDTAPPTAQTQYRIGSITKTLVAVGVLGLVDRGEVRLTDRIGDHLPDAPAGDSTIYQLLTHTAGLASETPPPWWERTDGTARPELRDILPAEPRRHPVGQVHHYSNPGFGLLGALLAAREERPWIDVVAERVLGPLGMTRTSYHATAPHAAGWAVHPWADVLLPEPAHDHGLLAAAGQLWSTPGDLCRFGVFLGGDGDGILSRETMLQMRAPAVAPDGPGWTSSYGLGVQHIRIGDAAVFGHTGSMPGFLAVVMTSVEDGLTVSVQSNAWSQLAIGELVTDLLTIVREQEPTMPIPWAAATSVDPGAYEIVGPWYWGAVAVAITLCADGDLDLAGIGGRGRAARFTATGDGTWRGLNGYYHGETLSVQRAAGGQVTHLDIGSFVLTRQPYAPGDVVPDGLDLGDWQL